MSEDGRGRPSTYTPELGDKVCASLEETGSLRKTCSEEGMPPESTVRHWVQDVDGFAAQYAKARQVGYENLADDLLAIADDGNADVFVTDEGALVVRGDVVARARLRVDTRKWLLSKVLPKIYGDKVALTGEGGGPVNLALDVRFVGGDDEEAA